jgi:hypothetical protein
MEVHAHTHTPRKKWTHYLWEFLMLFLAVFCGFLAENQREHIIEHRRAHDYAITLVKDLATDTSNINSSVKYYSDYISLMDSLIKMAVKKEINPATSGRFAWYCRHSLFNLPLPWQRTTIEQIRNSGNIRYFKSYRLQELISVYNMKVEADISNFKDENPSSDKCRDLANKILDVETNFEYSKIQLTELGTTSQSYIDSLISNRNVPLVNKAEFINEMVNMAIYRRRNSVPVINELRLIKKLAIDLINELKKEYHLE